MRHLGSVLLALVLTPVIWVLTGVGVSKFTEARAESSSGFSPEISVGLGAVLAAGLCYTLLVLPRISPLGPVLAGLGLLALTGWRLMDPQEFSRILPYDIFGVQDATLYPAEGYAAALAVPLLATIFSPRRWRRFDRPAREADPPGREADRQAWEAEGAAVAPAYQQYPPEPAYQAYPSSPAYPAAYQEYPATAGYPPQSAGYPHPPTYQVPPGGPHSTPTAGYPPTPYPPGATAPGGAAGTGFRGNDDPTDPTLPLPENPETTRLR